MSDAAVYAFAQATLVGQGYSEAELQFGLTVCRHETGYSTGWPADAGAGSNNWGAVTALVTEPHFDHVDTHADGRQFVSHFKVYPSPFHGLTDAFRAIMTPNVRAALRSGDGAQAAQAMHDNHYFEASVPSYVAALERNYTKLVNGAKLQPLLNFDGRSGGLGVLLLGLLFFAAKGTR